MITQNQTLGEIVANDFRTASYFKTVGIDFCCGGKMTLNEACLDKHLATETVLNGLNETVKQPAQHGQNFNEWELPFLADYIANTHHKYVLKTLPQLVFYTQKIADVHGEHHPELREVATLFGKINEELLQHLKNEEEVLFPAIKEALRSNSASAKATIASEIARMNNEHEFAGGAMDHINVITHHYALPADACPTYEVAFKLLEQFEDDLHVHVHLENNILFKKALLM